LGYVLQDLAENLAEFEMRFFPEGQMLLLLGARRRFAQLLIVVFALVKQAVVQTTTRFKSFAQGGFLRGSRIKSELESFSEHLIGVTSRQAQQPESEYENRLPPGVQE